MKRVFNSIKNINYFKAKCFLLLCFIFAAAVKMNSQVTVSGSTGANAVYTTLKAAFDGVNLNANQTGNVILISITANTVETATAILNQPIAGSWNSLTIKPASGITALISGNIDSAIIKLNGADFVTINGSNAGGTTRDLTISNNSSNINSCVVWLGSTSVTNGARSNTIKNCIINGNSPTTTFVGIVSSSSNLIGGVSETANSLNLFQNNVINKCSYGIALVGSAAGDSAVSISNNLIGSTSASNKIGFRGVYVANQINLNISNNTIFGVSSASSSTASGIIVNGGISGGNINANLISDIKNTNNLGWGSNGICVAATSIASNLTVSNNMISNIASYGYSNKGSEDNGYGIIIDDGGGYNIYYNTVSMDTNQIDISGFPAAFNITNNVTAVNSIDVRNNIFSNIQTVGVERYSVICNASANTFSQIDYNDYNHGSSPNLGYLGADVANLADWQTATGKDLYSMSVAPVFLIAQHINPSIASQIESGGINISLLTKDFDANIRQGNGGYVGTGTAPDIGADEFSGIASDLIPPSITYTAIGNNSCLSNDTVLATITDASGVNVVNGTKPRIWFKKSSNLNTIPGTNTNSSNGWKYSEANNAASPFSLIINYSLIFGGIAVGDTIQYFVVAQDLFSLPNIGINDGTFAAAPSNVALTVAAFPMGGALKSYRILSGLGGPSTVGTGGTYPTLTGVGGLFEAINANGLSSDLTVSILSNITESGLNSLNSIAYGCAANCELTIKPNTGITALISGSSPAAIIKLNGADFVTIDGSNSGGSSKDLSISNSNTGATSAVIWLASASSTDGASNNTIKNCTLSGDSPTSTIGAIITSSGANIGAAAEKSNGNNTFQNNSITKCSYGIALVGPITGESNNTIINNVIGSSSSVEKIGYRGLFISNQTNIAVSNNTIFGVNTASTSTASGIAVVGAISGGIISNNKISDIKNTNTLGYGANGIVLKASSLTSNLTIVNNMIDDIAGYGYNSGGLADNGYGIIVDNGGGYNIYFNTVSMNTNQSSDGLPAAFNVTNNVTGINSLNVRNNIFSNSQTMGVDRYSIICDAPANVFAQIDYNNYNHGSAPNIGYLGSGIANLAGWKAATGKDVNSLSIAPVFVSSSDLHLVIGSNCELDYKATPIAGITSDFDNNTRNTNAPDIGADEFENPTPILSSTLLPAAICSGATFNYTPSSVTPGVTFNWTRPTILGISEAGTADTTNVSEILTNTTGVPINVIYHYSTSDSVCSNIEDVIIVVNPNPSLSSSLTPPTICSGNAFNYIPLSLASGASFSWTRAAVTGINEPAATGLGNVNEILTNSTLSPITVFYFYTTTLSGCTNAPGQSMQVTVSQVSVLSSSLSPSICSGSIFNYTATTTTPGVSFTWSRAAVAGILQIAASGNANVSEMLTNLTSSIVYVTYVYTSNANGCIGASQNVVVAVNPMPAVSLSAFNTPICLEAPPLTLTGGTPTGGTYAGTGVSAGLFTPALAGVGPENIMYTVTENGCANAASQIITVQSCLGIESNNLSGFENFYAIYPNPSDGIVNISVNNTYSDELIISVYDAIGKAVYCEKAKLTNVENNKQINLKQLAKGLYYIKLSTKFNVFTQKLVIE